MRNILYIMLLTISSISISPSCGGCLDGVLPWIRHVPQEVRIALNPLRSPVELKFGFLSGETGKSLRLTPEELIDQALNTPGALYHRVFGEWLPAGKKLKAVVGNMTLSKDRPIHEMLAELPGALARANNLVNFVIIDRFNAGDPELREDRFENPLPTLLVYNVGGGINNNRFTSLDFYDPRTKLDPFNAQNRKDDPDSYMVLEFHIAIFYLNKYIEQRTVYLGEDFVRRNDALIQYLANPAKHDDIETALMAGKFSTQGTRDALLCLFTKEGIANGNPDERIRGFEIYVRAQNMPEQEKTHRIEQLRRLMR